MLQASGAYYVVNTSTVVFYVLFVIILLCLLSLQSEAQELTIVKMSKFGSGIGAPSKEEMLKDAAEIHIRLGQIQRYCELMVELGEVISKSYCNVYIYNFLACQYI